MDLSEYFTIPGKPGVFKMLSQSKSNAVMESLIDGKRLPVFTSDKISSLEEIGMFTNGEDVPLTEVFQNIFRKENGGQASVSPKADNKALQAYFSEVLPDWDKDRVYVSDIKKLITWYNLLAEKNLISLEEKSDKETAGADVSSVSNSSESPEKSTNEKS
ncbi:MAG: DUF5606 domain-containing protein [Bacteroidales bacterium]|nr:DUF5606 domain-containing protein [Bacteroidales bacterium]